MPYDKMMKERRKGGTIIILGSVMGFLLTVNGFFIAGFAGSFLVMIGLWIIIFSIVYGVYKWRKAIYEAQISRVAMQDERTRRAVKDTVEKQEVIQKIRCPHCGAEIKRRAKFCPKCGKKLEVI